MTLTKKRAAYLGGALVAVLVLLATVVAVFVGSDTDPANTAPTSTLTATVATPGKGTAHNAVLAAVPDAPAEVMTTPATDAWWGVLSDMLPDISLDHLNPKATGVDLVGYAYSLNVTQRVDAKEIAPFFPAVYAQTTSVEDAQKVMDWINTQEGSDFRRAWRDGTIVIITPGWIDQTVEYTLDTTSTTKALADRVGKPDDKAVWTLNLGNYRAAILQSITDSEQNSRTDRVFTALGVTDTSTLTVTVTDPAGAWTGAARDISLDQVNPVAIVNLINSSGAVVYLEDATDGTRPYLQETGMANVLRDSTITMWKNGTPLGSVGSADHSGETLRPNNADTALSGRITLATWESAFRGIDGKKYGATNIEFAMSRDGGVVLKPTFGPVVLSPATG